MKLTLVVSPADALAKGAPVWTKFATSTTTSPSGAVKGHEMWLLTHKDALALQGHPYGSGSSRHGEGRRRRCRNRTSC